MNGASSRGEKGRPGWQSHSRLGLAKMENKGGSAALGQKKKKKGPQLRVPDWAGNQSFQGLDPPRFGR